MSGEINNGKIPENHAIDHLDGNKMNNHISNLRLTTYALNNRNLLKAKNNTSGMTGVSKTSISFKDSGRCYEYWMAQWYLDYKYFQKKFSIKKFGEQGAFVLACEHREKMVAQLNLDGAGYTDRHGKEALSDYAE